MGARHLKPQTSAIGCGSAVAFISNPDLILAGQPWGVVYGLGLWVAKMALAIGLDSSISLTGVPQQMSNVCIIAL